MIARFFRFLALVGLVVASGCATPDPAQTLPELTFEHLGTLPLNVARIEVVSAYRSPMERPNVEHLFPTSPEKAARRWVRDRLAANGLTNRARLTIRDASALEQRLDAAGGVFVKDQTERYTVTLDVLIEVIDDRGFERGSAFARVSRSRTLAEDATLNEREALWFELVEALMQDFNAEMERNMKTFLVGWLM